LPTVVARSNFTAADAEHRACNAVCVFVERYVLPVVQRAGGEHHGLFQAYLLRVHCWLHSLRKLNHPSDFQAVSAGARALFEIAVDLALLRFDPECPPQKLLDWEQSAKLKAAGERLAVAQDGLRLPEGQDEEIYRDYVRDNEAAVRALRQRWNWKKHPNRWTGRNLRDDAERCDELARSQHGVHYRVRHAELCWSTHGSGFASVRGVSASSFPAITGVAFYEAGLFARTAAAHVLVLLDRFDASMTERFAQLDQDCDAARLAAVTAAREREQSGS
jgi:hypothetical protein